MTTAVILFSGGLDSTTCLAIAKNKHSKVIAVSFNYGQKHCVEIANAKKLTKKYQVEHIVLDLSVIGGSALTCNEAEIPDFTGEAGIPSTYVPARNTIFIAHALSIAEMHSADYIYLGVSAVDYSGYPDCRPEYIAAYQKLIDTAIVGRRIELVTPLISLSKAETIKIGLDLGVDYSETISCYRATEANKACGTCDSCILRAKGFKELNDQA